MMSIKICMKSSLLFSHCILFSDVKYPERRRLKIIDKVPPLEPSVRPPKHMRDLYRMRGPETIHNKLQYGDYGIQVCIYLVLITIELYTCMMATLHYNSLKYISKFINPRRYGGLPSKPKNLLINRIIIPSLIKKA